jgi:hypothetical protein
MVVIGGHAYAVVGWESGSSGGLGTWTLYWVLTAARTVYAVFADETDCVCIDDVDDLAECPPVFRWTRIVCPD